MRRQINQSIVIDAKVKTTLEGMNDVVSKLNQGLREGATKVDLTKGIGSSLSKNLDRFKDEYSKFSKFIEGGKIEFADAKDAVKSGEALIKAFKEMKRIVGDFDDLSVIDAKKLFPDAFDSRVTDLLGGLDKLSSAMAKLSSKEIDLTTAQTEMQELCNKAEELKTVMQDEIDLKIEADKAKGSLETVEQEIEAIRKKAAEGITLKINTAKQEASEAKTKRDAILAAREARGFNEDDFAGSRTGSTKFKGKTMAQWTAEGSKKGASDATKAEVAAAQQAIRLYEREKNALADLGAIIADREKKAKQLSDTLARLGTIKLPEAVATAGGSPQEITEATDALERQGRAIEANAAAQGKYKVAATQAGKAKKDFDAVTASIEQQQAKIGKLTLEIDEMKKEVSTEALEKAFSSAGVEGFTAEMLKSAEGVEQLRTKLNSLDDKKLEELKLALTQMGLNADQADRYIEELRGTLRGVENDANGIKRAAQEMDQLKNQFLQFFSLTNSVQLFRRAVTKALNTVKELDATMTEAAVVTEFDVSDMWDRLPQYSAEAQKLGVSINSMYQATTLYYQQGLKTNEAMALGVETMKMAKIAGMESTDATKAMTAALRGFNMELNELSATRVNDVYSQLAAVTAADTNQIATAMEKTASIAASANMEFETTAALLAQIIETTQEAPETAGTAMKTIIARFAEVKSLRDQGLTSGEDDEGEIIDVNKIQTALRSVGISMEGFFSGTEGLDSVLLKLAEKWGSLDFETQRYIATMAAGSRQQSRFIAMMSDYGRTTELVSQAQSSAGASQRQFEKTQDSLESKLQKLKNAWDEFLMGLSNSEVIKFAVDGLTFIVEGLNSIIDAISGGNGLVKALLSLMVVIKGLKLGRTILGSTLSWTGKNLGIQSGKDGANTGEPSGEDPNQQIVSGANQTGQKAGEEAGRKFIQRFVDWVNSHSKEAKEAGKKVGQEAQQGVAEGASGAQEDKTVKTSTNSKLKSKSAQKKVNRKTAKKLKKTNNQKALRKLKQPKTQEQAAEKPVKVETKEAENNLNNLDQASKNAKNSLDETARSAEESGNRMKEAGEKTKESAKGMEEGASGAEKLSKGLGTAAAAAVGTAAVLGLVANAFETAGDEETAEVLNAIATGFGGLGAAIMVVIPIVNALTAAGMAASAAFWWVIIIAAAIAAVIALVAVLISAITSDDLAEEMNNATEAARAAAEAAESAKKAYDELLKNREEYNGLQKNLQGLTKGTEEWREALMEANEQVLEMLATYPELAQYVKTGAHGQLTITDEGWDKAIDVASERKRAAAATAQTAAKRATDAKQRYQRREVADELGISKADLDTLSNSLLEDPDGFNEKINSLAEAADWTASELKEATQAISAYTAETIGNTKTSEAQVKGALTAAASTDFLAYEYSDALLTGLSKNYDINRGLGFDNANYSSYELALNRGASDDIEDAALTDEIINAYGLSPGIKDGDDLEMAQNLYMGMMGYTDLKQIPETIRENEAELVKLISQTYATKKSTEILDQMQKTLKNQAEDIQRRAAAVLSGEAGFANISDLGNQMSVEGLTKATGLSGEELAEIFGVEKEDLGDALKEYYRQANEAYEDIFKQTAVYGFEDELRDPIEDFNQKLMDLGSSAGLTLDQTDALAQSLAKVKLNGGDVDALFVKFSSILSGLSGADLDTGIAILAETDWSSKDSIDEAIDALRAFGVTIDTEVVKEIYNLAQAARRFSVKKVEEELASLQELMDSVSSKAEDGTKKFTKEERDALVNAGFGGDNFARTGINEYTYLGETNALLQTIEGYVREILGEAQKGAQESIDTGKRYDEFIQESNARYKISEKVRALNLNEETMELKDTTTDGKSITVSAAEVFQNLLDGAINFQEGTSSLKEEDLDKIASYIYGDNFKDVAWDQAGVDQMFVDANDLIEKQILSFDEGILRYNNETESIMTGGYEYSVVEDGTHYRKTASGEELLKMIASGEVGWKEDGSNEEGGISRTTLEILAKELDFSESEIEEAVKKGTGALYGLIQQGYKDYLNLEKNTNEANRLALESATMLGYQTAGTYEWYQQYSDSEASALRNTWMKDETQYLTERGQETLFQMGQRLASGDFDINTETPWLMTIANALGIDVTGKTIEEIATEAAKKFTQAFGGSLGLEAYISEFGGLNYMVDQLIESNQEFWENNKTGARQTVASLHKAQKAWEDLGKAVQDNIDNLNSLDPLKRAKGLSAVADSGKQVFGEWFDEKVVDEILKLDPKIFDDLINGVDGAEDRLLALAAQQFLVKVEVNKDVLGRFSTIKGAIQEQLDQQPLGVPLVMEPGSIEIAKENFDSFIEYMSTQGIVASVFLDEKSEKATWTFNKMEGISEFFAGSGSKNGGSSSKWENPYDEFYNTVEKINEELRKREKLELRYQRLLDRNAATAKELVNLTRDQLVSLEAERMDREGLLRGRERQIDDVMLEYSDLSKYAKYNWQTGQIEIDWNLLDSLDGSTDEELTSRIEEYISKLEEQQSLMEEEQDAIDEINDAVWEIYGQGKDEYFDFEERIKEAIIADQQKQIDKLSEINDSINDTNSKLLDSMQEQIDEYRQNRDNEKTEQELSDKQRRLAYLSQDTSGANILEIKQLQKELDEAQEDYTDTLIDQKISELQKQNDQAAEQRQQQIDLQQALLDQYSESPEIWEEVKQLMDEGLDPEKGLIRGQRLEELLKSTDGFDGMSKLKQMDWLNELNNTAAQALAWLEGGALQALYGQGGQVTFTDKDGNVITGTINENGDIETGDGRLYSGEKFKADQSGKVTSYESGSDAQTNWQEAQEQEEEEKNGAGDIASLPASTKLTKENKKALQRGLNRLLEHGKLSGFAKLAVDGILGSKTMTALAILQKTIGMSTTGAWGPKTHKAFHSSDLKAYETGGLADFTGPAWLDGTKSRPEYILNADQTKAFFTLVDVLSGFNTKQAGSTENTGDTNYDIDINVESIGSDYDVEQLADTVKRLINEDARYRNNNAINLMR